MSRFRSGSGHRSGFRLVAAFASAACVALGASACEDESTQGTLQREFIATPYGVEACDKYDGRLTVRRELRLYVNAGLDAERTAQGLQRFYRRYGITFYTTRIVETVDTAFVNDLDNAALNVMLRRDFPGVDFSDKGLTMLAMTDRLLFDRIMKAVINFQFRGAIDFASRFGREGQGITNVVVMKQLFTPQSPAQQRENVLGIALSPFLLKEVRRAGMDAQGLLEVLDLPPDFSPMVFINDVSVGRLEGIGGETQRDVVVGHEFGHSAGLVHRTMTGNLMNPSTTGRESCSLAISNDQIAVMRQGLGIEKVLARTVGGQDDSLAPRISPSLLAGVVRGDPDAYDALLEPLHSGLHAH